MGFRQWLGGLMGGANPSVPEEDSSEDEVAGLNFRSAIEVHQAWKNRLQAVIDGSSSETLSVQTVSKDDECSLGKWIYSQGSVQFGGDPLFEKLVKNHTHFHRCAGQVLALAQDGKGAEAQESVHSGEFVRASQTVVMDLAQMYNRATREGSDK